MFGHSIAEVEARSQIPIVDTDGKITSHNVVLNFFLCIYFLGGADCHECYCAVWKIKGS